MLKFRKLFPKKCAVIGMIHVNPLPGSPMFHGSIENIVSKACKETEIYLKSGLDGILIENMHDIPYMQSKYFGPETVATMARICSEVIKLIPETTPCGVQVLACGNKEALAIAKACSLQFIRAEGFVFSHIADEGFTDACAGRLLRYRKAINAEDVLVFADIKKKHSSHAITNDVSLTETAKAAEFFSADGLILTGNSTGDPVKPTELSELKANVESPILIGSGVTKENIGKYSEADALIIGSHFKKGGKWQNELDEMRVESFMEEIRRVRETRS